MLIFFIAGFLGGAVRGTLGVVKHTLSYKDVKMRWRYFGSITIISGFLGLISAWIIQELGIAFLEIKVASPAIALIVGYAGGDFLENIFKILMQKPISFKQGKK